MGCFAKTARNNINVHRRALRLNDIASSGKERRTKQSFNCYAASLQSGYYHAISSTCRISTVMVFFRSARYGSISAGELASHRQKP